VIILQIIGRNSSRLTKLQRSNRHDDLASRSIWSGC
jgi:hypothetical protein